MALVVVRASLDLTRAHGQEWLRAVEGLDLRFLVYAQDYGVLWRIHVQPHDVADLIDQQRVGRELKGLGPMRLQAKRAPDAIDGHPAQPHRLRHVPHTPVRRTPRRRLQGANDDRFHLCIGDGPWRARPRLVVQPVEAIANEPPTPLTNRRGRQPQHLRHRSIIATTRTRQYDPSAPRHMGSRPRSMGQRLESHSLIVRQHQRNLATSCPHAHPLVEQYERDALLVSLSMGQTLAHSTAISPT